MSVCGVFLKKLTFFQKTLAKLLKICYYRIIGVVFLGGVL